MEFSRHFNMVTFTTFSGFEESGESSETESEGGDFSHFICMV